MPAAISSLHAFPPGIPTVAQMEQDLRESRVACGDHFVATVNRLTTALPTAKHAFQGLQRKIWDAKESRGWQHVKHYANIAKTGSNMDERGAAAVMLSTLLHQFMASDKAELLSLLAPIPANPKPSHTEIDFVIAMCRRRLTASLSADPNKHIWELRRDAACVILEETQPDMGWFWVQACTRELSSSLNAIRSLPEGFHPLQRTVILYRLISLVTQLDAEQPSLELHNARQHLVVSACNFLDLLHANPNQAWITRPHDPMVEFAQQLWGSLGHNVPMPETTEQSLAYCLGELDDLSSYSKDLAMNAWVRCVPQSGLFEYE